MIVIETTTTMTTMTKIEGAGMIEGADVQTMIIGGGDAIACTGCIEDTSCIAGFNR
ncbi:MAG TPA: hypothetical protein VJ810_25900 [Blastocatellia bacterium]|nr:hypothetical protein [Blastocatellia bacterium]